MAERSPNNNDIMALYAERRNVQELVQDVIDAGLCDLRVIEDIHIIFGNVEPPEMLDVVVDRIGRISGILAVEKCRNDFDPASAIS